MVIRMYNFLFNDLHESSKFEQDSKFKIIALYFYSCIYIKYISNNIYRYIK